MPEEETPKSFPQTTPQDLYPTSDIRFVMLELGKLIAKVDRLIEDVRANGTEIKNIGRQIYFVKGAVWTIGIIFTLVVAAGTWYHWTQSH